MLELCSPLTILGNRGPVVRPRLVPVGAQSDHGLDREAHSGLRLANGLILRVMRDVRRAVEQLIDAMAAVCLDHAAISFLRDFFDGITVVPEESTGFHELDRCIKTVARCFYHSYAVRVLCSFANIVCFVQVPVEATMVERDVDVYDITVL